MVKGKWLPYEFGDYHWHKCSVCGKADKYIETIKRDNYPPYDMEARRNYCPACSAKMENENKVNVIGPESEFVEMKDNGEAIPVWYIDDWYTRNKHTVSIQSASQKLLGTNIYQHKAARLVFLLLIAR